MLLLLLPLLLLLLLPPLLLLLLRLTCDYDLAADYEKHHTTLCLVSRRRLLAAGPSSLFCVAD